MSGTEYARPVTLRLTAAERVTLARSVMRSIEVVSADLAVMREWIDGHDQAGHVPKGAAGTTEELARLRSLLERLTD